MLDSNVSSIFLSAISLILVGLCLLKVRSLQSSLLLILMSSYSLGFFVVNLFDLPLDIFSLKDNNLNRLILSVSLLLHWTFLSIGLQQGSSAISTVVPKPKSKTIALTAFLTVAILVILELFISKFSVLSGSYGNEGKTTYFYTYLSIPIACYLRFTRKPIKLFWFFIIMHIALCLLNGERLMVITTLFTCMFFSRPMRARLIHYIFAILASCALFLLDDLRSGGNLSFNIVSRFFSDGENVTHIGSILYSSLVLTGFGIEAFNPGDLFQSILYLFSLDGSKTGLGFSEKVASFAARGGGGLLPSFWISLFGAWLGLALTSAVSYAIGKSLQLFEASVCPAPLLLGLGLLPHAFAYSPILIVRPISIYFLSVGTIMLLAEKYSRPTVRTSP